jgi:peptidoglycan/LPS O-acetylase OafA/YrhL
MTGIREHPPPTAAPAAPATEATRPGRVVGLNGIRGLAALFVVLNHIFERAWPGYPAHRAPFWAAWMIYGRFAAVVFIALSGFSLGLGPARSGWRFKSIATYAHRRAWRILPPYWAALGFSLVMTWLVLAQPGSAVPNGKSVVVYGLLVQDAFSVGSPNLAFWSSPSKPSSTSCCRCCCCSSGG